MGSGGEVCTLTSLWTKSWTLSEEAFNGHTILESGSMFAAGLLPGVWGGWVGGVGRGGWGGTMPCGRVGWGGARPDVGVDVSVRLWDKWVI